MLMLGVLCVFSGQGEAQEAHGGHHEVMLEVMKNMALGLEMDESMAIGVEVTKVRATIQHSAKAGLIWPNTKDHASKASPTGAARSCPSRTT
jgi:hypothetical protein